MKRLFRFSGFLCLPILAALSPFALADIQLPKLFSDGAVLQRDQAIPVWGNAAAGVKVDVSLGGKSGSAVSDSEGRWQLSLPALPAGGPYALAVHAGDDSVELNDIYLGDVWVASGQSNMEWVLRDAKRGPAEMASEGFSEIRHFKVPKSWAVMPSETLAGGDWQVAQGEAAGNFSAIGYFFAKKIHTETGVPVGLIGSNWGGSKIEAWMSPAALGRPEAESLANLQKIAEDNKANAKRLTKALERWPGAMKKAVSGPVADWSAASLDTADWDAIDVPGYWEQQQFEGVDGFFWYRTSFTLTAEQAAGDAVLGLARIDDNDIAWVNGKQVGSTNAYNAVRDYQVPATVLKAGLNTLAVRVEDTGGGGGIYSDADLLFLATANGDQLPLAGSWKIRADQVVVDTLGELNHVDSALYNKMLNPLFRQPIKGVIWYQGESNTDDAATAYQYKAQFKAMIAEWRQNWQLPELPFYWVQLANFETGDDGVTEKPWAILRESQTAALDLPNTGQAIIIDVGEPGDIHPRDKQTVGDRLAYIALNQVYGKADVHFRGPVFDRVEQKGSNLIVHFTTDKGLTVAGGGNKVGAFEIAGKDGKFVSVNGKIKGSTVVLKVGKLKVAEVRYAFDDSPEGANLADKTGLPAEPFRIRL